MCASCMLPRVNGILVPRAFLRHTADFYAAVLWAALCVLFVRPSARLFVPRWLLTQKTKK